MGNTLTINGVTFDRGRIRPRSAGRLAIFHADDAEGSPVLAVHVLEPWEFYPAGTVAVVYIRHVDRPIFLDAAGHDLGSGASRGEDSWAPVLDLAVAAGLQLPEVPGD
jgi:hypothetical protein